MKKITVIGSLNMDLVVRAASLPRPGETIFGHDFETHCGGKGANQAMGCGRMGGAVAMVGCVGEDDFGHRLLEALSQAGVDVRGVRRQAEARSGCALITVADDSQNSIVVVAGANALLSEEDLGAARDQIGGVVLLQLETPPETNRAAARMAREAGATVILDPAPASAFRFDLLENVDIVTPNQTEVEAITGVQIRGRDDLHRAMDALAERWPGTTIVKMGSQGAYWRDDQGKLRHSPVFKVNAVDTVAAGDAFNAGLAVALAEGRAMEEAVEWASAAGALCVTRRGAGAAMPTREEVTALLASGERC